MLQPQTEPGFPLPLSAYPPAQDSLLATLADRIAMDPFNAVATAIFALAIVHTFSASWFARLAHGVQHRHDARLKAAKQSPSPSTAAELLHFFGEVEVVFGLWTIPLLAAIAIDRGWLAARHYVNDTVVFIEPLFVVVIMALASTRPMVTFAENALRRVAMIGGGTPAAWWFTILTIGPVLGSLITEPGAMTISALLLTGQFYDLEPSQRLKYATLGLLFVNVSIGGTLTHFAAPPVLMVARAWDWDTSFMLGHFGWRAIAAIVLANLSYYALFRRELSALGRKSGVAEGEPPGLPVPAWIVVVHALFMTWTVVNAHHPTLFIGGFLIFLGFARATAAYQAQIDLKAPLLVGFFLAGLVIHGGLQGWWIAPVLASLGEEPLFYSATALTAFNDNALITSLATLVPNLDERMKIAIVEGAVTGGGLTVIANAPNPAGQALLGRFFDGSIKPIGLFLGALPPTLIVIVLFRLV
jgi:putative Na+/H+ antiporter